MGKKEVYRVDKGVEKDVHEAYKLLASFAGVGVGKNDLPRVVVTRGGTPCYDLRTHTIEIPEENIGNGPTYFEEAGHALRAKIRGEEGRELKGDPRVEEFYGKVCARLGRELSKGTRLEPTYGPHGEAIGPAREDWAILIKHARALGRNSRALRELEQEGGRQARELIETADKKIMEAVNDLKRGRINPSQFYEFVSRIGEIYGSHAERISKLMPDKDESPVSMSLQSYQGAIGLLKEYGQVLQKTKDRNAREEIIEGMEGWLRDYKKSSPLMELANEPGGKVMQMRTDARIASHEIRAHRKSYEAANRIPMDKLVKLASDPDFFRLPDEVVRQKYIFAKHRKAWEESKARRRAARSALEHVAAGLLAFAVGVLTAATLFPQQSASSGRAATGLLVFSPNSKLRANLFDPAIVLVMSALTAFLLYRHHRKTKQK